MRKYTINTFPKQWYVLADTNEKDAILVDYYNKTFKDDLSKGLGGLAGWYFFSEKIKNESTGDMQYYLAASKELPKGFEEILYDEFIKYVLNEEFKSFVNEDHSQLIKLLNDVL